MKNTSLLRICILFASLIPLLACEDSGTSPKESTQSSSSNSTPAGISSSEEIAMSSSIAEMNYSSPFVHTSSPAEISSSSAANEPQISSSNEPAPSSSITNTPSSSSKPTTPSSNSSGPDLSIDAALIGTWQLVTDPSGQAWSTLEITQSNYDSGNNGSFIGTNKFGTFYANAGYIGIWDSFFGKTPYVSYLLSNDTLYVYEPKKAITDATVATPGAANTKAYIRKP